MKFPRETERSSWERNGSILIVARPGFLRSPASERCKSSKVISPFGLPFLLAKWYSSWALQTDMNGVQKMQFLAWHLINPMNSWWGPNIASTSARKSPCIVVKCFSMRLVTTSTCIQKMHLYAIRWTVCSRNLWAQGWMLDSTSQISHLTTSSLVGMNYNYSYLMQNLYKCTR